MKTVKEKKYQKILATPIETKTNYLLHSKHLLYSAMKKEENMRKTNQQLKFCDTAFLKDEIKYYLIDILKNNK